MGRVRPMVGKPVSQKSQRCHFKNHGFTIRVHVEAKELHVTRQPRFFNYYSQYGWAVSLSIVGRVRRLGLSSKVGRVVVSQKSQR